MSLFIVFFKFYKLVGWSMESLFWWVCIRNSGWICYEIWYRVYLLSDDVSNRIFRLVIWKMNVRNFGSNIFVLYNFFKL